MTNSLQSPFSPDQANLGALPAWEGKVLHRSGEELRLEKMPDRFTLSPSCGHSLDRLARFAMQMNAEILQDMRSSIGLVELQTRPEYLEEAMQIARKAEEVQFASHVYQLVIRPGTPIYLTPQLTIQFAEFVNAEQMKTIATAFGLRVLKLVPGVPKAFAFEVTDRASANPIKIANRLMQCSEVLMAEPNIAVPIQWFGQPNIQADRQPWPLHPAEAQECAPNSPLAVEAAWNITQGNRSIGVAIVEQAIDLDYPGFQGKGKIVAPVEFGKTVFGKTERGEDAAEKIHSSWPGSSYPAAGTLCAEWAVAEATDRGRAGIAPGCALMPIQIGELLDDRGIEQICEWAIAKGAAVLSCGWGASAGYFPLSLRQRAALTRVATQGRDGKGCVVVFAAGNANHPVDGAIDPPSTHQQNKPDPKPDPDPPVRYPTPYLNGFAVHPEVITVAATCLDRKAADSNWGTSISVCAPGYHPDSPGNTAVAGAIVAGVAALVLSVNPDLTAREVKQMLQDTADRILDPDPDPHWGLQFGRYDANGHSQWFGYGQVNAFRAVQAAQHTLRRMGIPSRWIEAQNLTSIDIPDCNLQGVTSAIEIQEAGLVHSIEIQLEIEHSFMGDLEVYLTSPRDEAILLQNRTLGSVNMFRHVYSLDTTPLLQRLLNQPAAGQWQLKLIDYAPLNTGRLRYWGIRLGISADQNKK